MDFEAINEHLKTKKTRARELRELNGFTRGKVARDIGMQELTYLRLENNPVGKTSVESYYKLAAYYGVSLDYLFGFETKPIQVTELILAKQVMMLPKNERQAALKEVLNDFRKDIKTLQQHKKTDKGLGMLAEYINKAGGIDNFVDNILSSDKDKDLDKKGGEQKNLPKTKDHRLLQKTHKDVQHETKPLMSGKVNAKSEPKQNLNLNNR